MAERQSSAESPDREETVSDADPARRGKVGETPNHGSQAEPHFSLAARLFAVVAGLQLITAVPPLVRSLSDRAYPVALVVIYLLAITAGGVGVWAVSLGARRLAPATLIPALAIATPVIRQGRLIIMCPVMFVLRLGVDVANLDPAGPRIDYYGVNLITLVILLIVSWLLLLGGRGEAP